jgi:Uma2 family endonuclease
MLVNEMERQAARRETMAVEVAAEPRRRLFTSDEYCRMVEAGILTDRDRVELIRGEIVWKMSIGPRHLAFVDNLTELLVLRLAGRAIVSVQSAVVASDDSVPEPDLKILRRRSRSVPYKERLPHAEDVLLLIEVADSSLKYDRSTKLALYAEAGIAEYWIVNCPAESIEIHRRPEGGRYLDVVRVEGPGTVTLQPFPDVTLTLAEIFA